MQVLDLLADIYEIIFYWINSQVFSAGRDKNIYLTDLRQTDRHTLVCQEEAPVLKMILTPDQQGKPTVSRGFVSLIVFVVQCAKGVCVCTVQIGLLRVTCLNVCLPARVLVCVCLTFVWAAFIVSIFASSEKTPSCLKSYLPHKVCGLRPATAPSATGASPPTWAASPTTATTPRASTNTNPSSKWVYASRGTYSGQPENPPSSKMFAVI